MNNLKLLRNEKKLTQQNMADFLGVERSTYGKYESGDSEPNFDTIHRLAAFFEVTVEYLMGISDQKKALTSEEVSVWPQWIELQKIMAHLSPAGQDVVIEQARQIIELEKQLKGK